MRKLKHHERKLLKKTNFLQWKSENNHRELEVIRRYHVQDREEYKELNKVCGMVTKLTNLLRQIDPRDPNRVEMTEKLLDKLYSMGAIPSTKSLTLCDKLSTSSFLRRRLSVVMVRLKMSETLREAVTFIEQGHVRVHAWQDKKRLLEVDGQEGSLEGNYRGSDNY